MRQYRLCFFVALLSSLGIFCDLSNAAESVADARFVHAVLRADWSQASGEPCAGSIELSEGSFQRIRALELSGRVQCESGVESGRVHFSSFGPSSWTGLEIAVLAPATARVVFVLDGRSLEISFAELLQGIEAKLPADGGVRLRRDPSDILQARVRRSHLILAPHEPAELDLDFNFYSPDSRDISTQLHVSLSAARGGPKLFAAQDKLLVPASPAEPARRTIKIRTPATEGAFDLVVRAEPQGMPPVERVIQFVVFDANQRHESESAELVTEDVQEIDPAIGTIDAPWYSTRRIKARTTRLGQFLWSSVRYPFAASDKSTESPVLLCRLDVANPARPHLLQLEYEDSNDLLLAAAITEHDPDQRWEQVPTAAGTRGTSGTLQTQSLPILFWPRSHSPSLSVYVQGAAGLAAIKKIRLQEITGPLPPLDLPDGDPPKRLFGLCIDPPDAWASWGSARTLDGNSRVPLDDWNTFFESMKHLTEYARYAGYNALQPTVIGHGGAMYPTELLAPNLRLDSGRADERGTDPMPKDVVELLLRIGTRHRLAVVPNIRLDTRIASLDRRLESDDALNSGLLLVSREGKLWTHDSAAAADLPRYNPLHPAVQAAMLEVIREFVERYASHSVFHDLSFDLSGSSHAVLPGLEWGYDDATVADFAREMGVAPLPDGPDPAARFAQRYQQLTSTAREQWIAWRCRKMAAFYTAVLAELKRVKPRGRVMLPLTALSISASDDARDLGRSARSIEETLRARGIDLRGWNLPADIIVLRPFAAAPGNAESRQLNSSRELDELMAHLPSRGSVCLHEPEVIQFSATNSSDRHDPLTESIAVPISFAGRGSARRYAQSLASGDCLAILDGGTTTPLGQESVQRDFARLYRSLPIGDHEPVETPQPVVLRTTREPRDSFATIVNEASYAIAANLIVSGSPSATLVNRVTGDALAGKPAADGFATKIALEPFQTVLLKLPAHDTAVLHCDVVVPQAAESRLKGRFDRLAQAMAVMGRDSTRTLAGLPPNGDFEESAAQPSLAAAWHAEDENTVVTLDHEVTHSGQMALRVAGAANGTVASEDFQPPDSRALAMNVWLRASRPGQRVRWFLIADQVDQPAHRCYADVILSTQWEQKQFRARDLPDQRTAVRVSFQLLDEGTIWIDEARLCAIPISQDEKLAISKSFSAIFKAWKDRRLSDFERLTDGYWATYLLESVEASHGPEIPTQGSSM